MTIASGAAMRPDDDAPTGGTEGIAVNVAPDVVEPEVATPSDAVPTDDDVPPFPTTTPLRVPEPTQRMRDPHAPDVPGPRPEPAEAAVAVVAVTTTETAPAPSVAWADRIRAAVPVTGPGLTGLGAVLLGALVVGLGTAADLWLGAGLGVGFTATFLLACVLVATTVRPRALATAAVLPPLLFAGGQLLETTSSGQTAGRRQMALDVATSLALTAPVLFAGTALALLVVLTRLVLHLARR